MVESDNPSPESPSGAVTSGAPDARSDESGIRVVDRRWWARAADADAGSTGDVPASDKPSYVQDLEQRLAAKDEELRATIARYREAAAEFDDVRARLRRDAAKEIERGRRLVLADLLEVVDNLDRAIEAARSTDQGSPVFEGVERVRAQFLAKLEAHGVGRVPSLHQAFDPTHHEAATSVPVPDASQDGIIVGVIREGYVIGDEVLRPAMVAVGRFSQGGAER